MHIRQAELPALVCVSEPFMIEAEAIENRRLKIVNVDFVLDDVKAEIIG